MEEQKEAALAGIGAVVTYVNGLKDRVRSGEAGLTLREGGKAETAGIVVGVLANALNKAGLMTEDEKTPFMGDFNANLDRIKRIKGLV